MATSSKNVLGSIRRQVCGDFSTADVNVLYDLTINSISPQLAATELVQFALQESDTRLALSDISTQILSLACESPFAHFQLAALIGSVTEDVGNDIPSEAGEQFRSTFATALGDLAQSEYAQLQDQNVPQESDQATEYVHLNGFIAHLLAILKLGGSKRVTGLDDALFIITNALEEEPAKVDVRAAAQYFIHATNILKHACQSQ